MKMKKMNKSGWFQSNYRKIFYPAILLVITLVMTITPATPVVADDTDWVGTPVSQNGSGVSSPQLAITPDEQHAIFTDDNQWWQYTLSGLPAIEAGATITGIEINVLGRKWGTTADRDLQVRLSKDGTNYTTEVRVTPDFGTGASNYQSVGEEGDLWGWSWSPDDFTASGFWVRFDGDNDSDFVGIDYFQIKVFYEPPPLYPESFVTGGATINCNNDVFEGLGLPDKNKPVFTISGTVGFLEDAGLTGQFQIVIHSELAKIINPSINGAITIHLNSFNNLEFSGTSTDSPPANFNVVEFSGTGFSNKIDEVGYVTIIITDNAEPGKGFDTIEMIGLGLGPIIIDDGNFQVHDAGLTQ